MHGGDRIAEVLQAHGVRFLLTLCGGHISPILAGCKSRGIRVVDVRHEATAVFAADAISRLSGVPGVAAVTAGPGVTNTITAVKNAQLAQSPLVLLGGATATALKGRGALQDIDQMALFRPHVKWLRAVKRVRDLAQVVDQAFREATRGIPGPVFVECPVDLLYDEATIRKWYGVKSETGTSLREKAVKFYLQRHVERLFAGADNEYVPAQIMSDGLAPGPARREIENAARLLRAAQRPVLLVGSQAVTLAPRAPEVADAVARIGLPVYLSGMARGLLGKNHHLHMRHQRRQALREADLVVLAGVPCDFRLDYGRHIRGKTKLVSINRSREELRKNRRPTLGIPSDAGLFLIALAAQIDGAPARSEWLDTLRARDAAREQNIATQAAAAQTRINPLKLCAEIERVRAEDCIFIADGGDFVATASYIVRPPGPLRWLDPGVFGTLGVGAGFALGAKLLHPEAEVWLIYGDGSVGYTLSEFDTFVRHQLPVIAVVGNDASWAQIAREQVEILHDDVGTVLSRTDYHRVVEGFGARGFLLQSPGEIRDVLQRAQEAAAAGHPALINAHLEKTDFRKGSISI